MDTLDGPALAMASRGPAAREVRRRYPCETVAAVVLPDHLHPILRLPTGDADFPARWRYLKWLFVRALPRSEYIPANRARRGERGIWLRRYWEHMIRDDDDLRAHVDYIHFNPVKQGLVDRVRDWPHSSFRTYVRAGVWSERSSVSQKDEQEGYLRIYAGAMKGIRNPATHEFDWVDNSDDALELLLVAQHLLRKAKAAFSPEEA